jgi:hypothetical protein
MQFSSPAIDSLVGFFQILPYLLRHPQLVVALGFRARMTHRSLHHGIRSDPTQPPTKYVPQVVDRNCLWAAITVNLTPIESAICGRRRRKVFGQRATAAPKLFSMTNFLGCRVISELTTTRSSAENQRSNRHHSASPLLRFAFTTGTFPRILRAESS